MLGCSAGLFKLEKGIKNASESSSQFTSLSSSFETGLITGARQRATPKKLAPRNQQTSV